MTGPSISTQLVLKIFLDIIEIALPHRVGALSGGLFYLATMWSITVAFAQTYQRVHSHQQQL